MELEFDFLDVAGKLVKYVVHLSKRKNRGEKKFPSLRVQQPIFGLKEF
jgi:hypothetical protein